MAIKNIHILLEAEMDLIDGRNFYENQKQGIGEYFWSSLISDIESLIIYGGIHSKQFNFYRMSSKRFPYSIYYDVNEDNVYVMAVLPEKRNPHWVNKKIKGYLSR